MKPFIQQRSIEFRRPHHFGQASVCLLAVLAIDFQWRFWTAAWNHFHGYLDFPISDGGYIPYPEIVTLVVSRANLRNLP